MDQHPILSDHDVLITLNAKVDQLNINVKEIKDDLLSRVVKVETRLDAVDIYHAKIDLDRLIKIADWAENLRTNIKFITTVGGLGVGLVGAILAHFLQIWFHF